MQPWVCKALYSSRRVCKNNWISSIIMPRRPAPIYPEYPGDLRGQGDESGCDAYLLTLPGRIKTLEIPFKMWSITWGREQVFRMEITSSGRWDVWLRVRTRQEYPWGKLLSSPQAVLEAKHTFWLCLEQTWCCYARLREISHYSAPGFLPSFGRKPSWNQLLDLSAGNVRYTLSDWKINFSHRLKECRRWNRFSRTKFRSERNSMCSFLIIIICTACSSDTWTRSNGMTSIWASASKQTIELSNIDVSLVSIWWSEKLEIMVAFVGILEAEFSIREIN